MTGINIVKKVLIVVCVIVISAITSSSGAISDQRLCFDPKCSEPVSIATTLMRYQSNDPAILSFESNIDVTVFSKAAGKRKDLWGVEINGKRGYIPVNMIKEKRVLKKNLIHKVPTEESEASAETNNVPNVTENVEAIQNIQTNPLSQEETEEKLVPMPSQVSPSFEVHDGTTIPLVMIEEPSVPSYSTVTPQAEPEVQEHPVLSVHPNIASSVTLENKVNEISIDDTIDAPKYLEMAGLSKDSSSEQLNNSPDEESRKTVPIELNYSNERDSEDSSNVHRIPNDVITATNANLASENNVPLKLQDSAVNDDHSLHPEKPIEPENLTNNVSNNMGEELTENSEDISSQQAETEKTLGNLVVQNGETAETGAVKEVIKEEVNSSEIPAELVTEQNIETRVQNNKEKVVAGMPVMHEEQNTTEQPAIKEEEKSTETLVVNEVEITPEMPIANEEESTIEKPIEKEERIVTEMPVKNEKEKIAEEPIVNKFTTKSVESQNSKIPAENTVAASTETEKISENQTIVPQTDVKLENDVTTKPDTEPLKESQVEIGAPIQDDHPVSEESSDAKASEEVPPNLDVMNPIFGRLSSMVKQAVNNAFSANSETGDETLNDTEPENKIDENESKSAEIQSEDSTTKTDFIDQIDHEKIVNIVDSNNNNLENEINRNDSTADNVNTTHDVVIDSPVQPGIYKEDELSGLDQVKYAVDETPNFNGFPANRNLLNVGSNFQPDNHESAADSSDTSQEESMHEFMENKKENEVNEKLADNVLETTHTPSDNFNLERDIVTESTDSCLVDSTCQKPEGLDENHSFVRKEEGETTKEEVDVIDVVSVGRNYWEILTYLVVTALTTLLFSLGYYYIENMRRDSQYIAKINELEKQLLVCGKECTMLDDTLKSTKTKLDSIEDESFGSNEMVASLKADLEASKTAKSELEDQVAILEKELESATEAGLELERMLREILTTNNEDNPLARSVEDLQTRLNAQQAANEALTNALNLKAQENEALTAELKASSLKSEQLEVEVTRLTEELKHQYNLKNNLEHTLLEKVENLEKQVKDITAERINLRQQLKGKEMELNDLLEVVNQMNINNLDFDKLYNVSKVKAEASQLLEERDDLKIRLAEVEGAHQLLEEHVKLINEEVASLSEQCKLAEKAKRDAETRVEVLSNFFKEKEAQRQKEEAVWLEKQGEVSSTVERLHAMQNEIHNYKQQIEMLKREILDQEREYKNQISTLETKSHENWVIARQNERRLEESKAEAGQLRNRLTLIEKNLNETDPEAKLHRLEANGETPTSPQLYMGAEASSSPIMFSASSGVPLPPPPSYLYGPPVPPFMPPPPHSSSGMTSYEVGQRPPPLGGRLSSPPPLPSVNSGRYDNPRSPPPHPIIPSYGGHRPFPPFGNERIHPPPPPPPPPHSSHLPPPLPPLGSSGSHPWPDEAIPPPPLRNSGFQAHQQQSQHHHLNHPPLPHHHHHQHRDNQQRSRNLKGRKRFSKVRQFWSTMEGNNNNNSK
ncbi:transport and Golgi organization protein 1 isoform X3 [Venturia canescens]|uniref:transport and Golgi organization protein 1 isoform X3 n=1 Tax=Venturia canescens TaxID=32260 RepID=UPI001C9C9FC7|nr:transport and Golgi organization protein 1-like isoform X3 [Venturia canescens]